MKSSFPAKGKAFKKGMLIYICVLAVLIIASQVVLWTFLDSYQKAQCEDAAKKYIESLGEDNWSKILLDNIIGSDYQTKEIDVKNAYNTFIKGKNIVCRRSAGESSSESTVIKISVGGTVVCNLTLTESGKGAYNMPRWSVAALSFDETFLDKVNPLTVLYLPVDSSLTVGGKSANISKAELCTNPLSNELEKENKNYYRFEFRTPCGECDISASLKDKKLDFQILESGAIFFKNGDVIPDIIINAPKGSEVYVNEIRLSTKYITNKDAKYPLLNPLEENVNDIPLFTEYTVNGMTVSPTIRVVYNGTELVRCDGSDENSFFYRLADTTHDYTLRVPCSSTVTVNGIDISADSDFIISTDTEYPNVSKYSDGLINPTGCTVYFLEGLFLEPTIFVTDENGNEYSVYSYDNNCYEFFLPLPQIDASSYESYAIDFAHAMMEYSFLGRDKLAESFNNVLSKTEKNSDAYLTIYNSYSGMYWRREYSFEYNEVTVNEYVKFADNAFRCDVHYNVTGKRLDNGRIENVIGIYRLLFIKTGDGWKVAELSLLSEKE